MRTGIQTSCRRPPREHARRWLGFVVLALLPNALHAADPADGAYVLRIEAPFARALPDWLPLRVNLTVKDGKPTQAIATAIHLNNNWYPVDLTNLRLADGRCSGSLAVTFRADDYERAAMATGKVEPGRGGRRYDGSAAQALTVDCPIGEMTGPAPGGATWEKDVLNIRSAAGKAAVRAWRQALPAKGQPIYAEFQLMRWDSQTTSTGLFDGMTSGGALLLRCAIRDGKAGEWVCLQGPERYALQTADLIWRVEDALVSFRDSRLEGGFTLAPASDAAVREGVSKNAKYAKLPDSPVRVKLAAQVVGAALVGTAEIAHATPTTSVVLGSVRATPFALHADRTPRTWAFTAAADPALVAAARKEALVAIRPGEPGRREFWTDSARFGGCDIFIRDGKRVAAYDFRAERRIIVEPYEEYRAKTIAARVRDALPCIAAPSFSLKPVAGAVRYRLTAKHTKLPHDPGNGFEHSFEADAPWVPLTPIWDSIPVHCMNGDVPAYKLTVTGLDAQGKEIGEVQTVPFVKFPSFEGPYFKALPRTCREAALLSARWMRDHPVNTGGRIGAGFGPCFGTGGDGQQWYTTYSGVYAGLALAQVGSDAEERAAGLDLAVTMGDLWLRTFAGNYLPDTYKGWVFDQWVYGCAWLDLFRLTGDPRHRDLALELARRLAAKQLPSGTWAETNPGDGHVSIDAKTGLPSLISIQGPSMQQWDPSSTLYFLGRVRKELKSEEFRAAEDKAWQWLQENSIARFDWRKQGPHASEDHKQPWLTIPDCALHCYEYLALDLPGRDADPALLEDLLRWSEDRNVDWRRQAHATAVAPRIIHLSKNRDTQLRMALAFARHAQRTGSPLHKAKAEALAGAMLVAQFPTTGQIPHVPDIDARLKGGAGYSGPGSGDGGNRGEYATMALLELSRLWDAEGR